MLGRVWQTRREGLTSKASFHHPLWILGPVAVDQGAQSLLCRFAAHEMLHDDCARGPAGEPPEAAFEAIYWVLERHKRVAGTKFWVAISSTEIPKGRTRCPHKSKRQAQENPRKNECNPPDETCPCARQSAYVQGPQSTTHSLRAIGFAGTSIAGRNN